jgi:transcriptional regulator with XRE-family HTH domain
MAFEESSANERLRRARLLKGWTQSDLAEALGTDFETVSRWERGITMPSPYYLGQLARVLGKSAEELGLLPDVTAPFTTSALPGVFLASAYADANSEFVIRLKGDLQSRGLSMWSSRTVKKHGGENKKRVLQEAIRAANLLLLIVSPQAPSSRHVHDVLQLAKIYGRRVCAVWIEGEHWQECLPRDCSELSTTIDARKGYEESVLNEIVATLEKASLPSDEIAISPCEPHESSKSPSEPRNPYKGLNAFRHEDRYDFFGRDAFIDELVAALQVSLRAEEKSNQDARLLAIVGPSGSGKSSVVMAGLLPRLQAGGLCGSEDWIYLNPMVPGVHPIESLACALAEHLPDKTQNLMYDELEEDSTRRLHQLTTVMVKHQGQKVVLFVDQFEELFTQTSTQEERQYFMDLLLTALTKPGGPLIVILTLRADFYDRLLSDSAWGLLIQNHHCVVLPMDMKDLRTAIERPAALPDVQLTFEGDLVGDLLFEVQGQAGALPLLQFTLDQLFQRRSEHQLTLQAYHEIGGVKGALAKHAESTYASLPSEEHRRLVPALFLRLIEPGATEQESTRRRAALSELLLPDPKEAAIMGEVAQAFTTARLLISNSIAGIPTLEVSHEALIWEWKRLTDWLHTAREDIRLQQTISEDVLLWEQRGKPKDRLYRGSQLVEAKAWAKRNIPSRSEMAFLQASARQRVQYVISVLAIVLVLLSTVGLAVWLRLQLPPDPTQVTNLQDDGPGSLRWAITNAPSGSTIMVDASLRGTVLLTSGALSISRDLHIRGPGAESLAISGGEQQYSIFVSPSASVSISGLLFKGSSISNEGTLELINSIISDNNMASVANSVGGGISNKGTLTLTNSMVSDNIAASGGGIYNGGTLTLTNSTVSDNTAASYSGGGILNEGRLTLINSTVSDNTAPAFGGGIVNNGINAKTTITFCTVYGNKTEGSGGGIWNGVKPSQIVMRNSIVAANSAPTDPDIQGTLISGGYNLIQDTSGAIFSPNQQHATDVVVDPQTDLRIDSLLSGQLPPTHALRPGSPAIDRIPLNACSVNGISTDQRGMKRPDGNENMCDIGAYEYTD